MFARHDTFHIRDGWLTKGLNLVEQNLLSKQDIHHDIGVGINMLKSIKHWLEATNLVKKDSSNEFSFSDLGKFIYQNDKYFEDNASLWLIHYSLAKNLYLAPIWYYIFNLNQESSEFELNKTENYVQIYFSNLNKTKNSINSIIKDIRCFIKTYVNDNNKDDYDLSCPLSELNLVNKLSNEKYNLNFGKKDSLPLEVFLVCLIDFAKSDSDIEIGRLRFNSNSPGKLFCLSYDAIRDYISEACFKYPNYFSQIKTYESEEIRILDDKKIIIEQIYNNIY